MYRAGIRWISSSSVSLKGPRNYVHRKTGRGSGNSVLPRFEWRYNKSLGNHFQKAMGMRYGIDMGLEDRLLLGSLGTKHRRLDEKKIIQLSRILEERIGEVISTDETLALLNLQITQVRVDRAFTQVSVYWMCTGEDDSKKTEILEQSKHQIRRRVAESIGTTCPELKFLGDKSLVMEQELDNLLRTADYGVDYRLLSKSAQVLGNVKTEESSKKINIPKWMLNIKEKKAKTES